MLHPFPALFIFIESNEVPFRGIGYGTLRSHYGKINNMANHQPASSFRLAVLQNMVIK